MERLEITFTLCLKVTATLLGVTPLLRQTPELSLMGILYKPPPLSKSWYKTPVRPLNLSLL